MARIAFFVWPIAASVVCTTKLARELRDKGHEIFYLGTPECRRFTAAHDLPFVPVYESAPSEASADDAAQDRDARKAAARARIEGLRALLRAIGTDENREFQDRLAELKPDLLIIQSSDFDMALLLALLAYELRVRSIYFTDTLCRTEDRFAPPVRSPVVPDRRWPSLSVWLAWKKLWLGRRVGAIVSRVAGLGHRRDLALAGRRIADRCGYPWGLVETTDTLQLRMPLAELVAWPARLEFPAAASRPGRHYVGPLIDLDRKEPGFPWERVDSRPLVYCALGTYQWRSAKAYARFFRTVFAVAATRPDLQWVVGLGDVAPSEFATIPANVVVAPKAPQLALLRRAAIAISHGGANTVIECAYFGVPTIVFPLGFDHYGYAARVVYHGLGLRADFRTIDAAELGALVARVEKDSYIQSQARLLGAQLRAERSRAIELVESLLDDRSGAAETDARLTESEFA